MKLFQIDSHFCAQTLDSLPTAEAPSKKNKCVYVQCSKRMVCICFTQLNVLWSIM